MLGLIAPGRSFRPSNIAGIQLWLDASVESSLGNTYTAAGGATNNGPVKFWGDLSGNARNASRNAADSAVPTLLSGNQNGLSVCRFDGGDWLRTVAFQAFPSKRGTILAALNNRKTFAAGSNTWGTIAAVSSGTSLWQWYVTSSAAGTSTQYAWWSGTGIQNKTPVNPQGWQVVSTRRSSDAAIITRTNGVTDTAGGTFVNNQPANSACDIGAYNGTEFSVMDLGELIFFSRDLSDAELTTVERYLANKWGVTI